MYLKIIIVNKVLVLLIDFGILSKDEIEVWKNFRNEVVYLKVKSNNLLSKYEEKENFIFCFNLFNFFIF